MRVKLFGIILDASIHNINTGKDMSLALYLFQETFLSFIVIFFIKKQARLDQYLDNDAPFDICSCQVHILILITYLHGSLL